MTVMNINSFWWVWLHSATPTNNMELTGGTLEDDPYAGYLVDDSDLEYSECSDDDNRFTIVAR